MTAELLLSAIVFLVLAMLVVLVFMNMSRSHMRPKSLPRPKISYPDPLPGPEGPEMVQGVNTALMAANIHDEDAAIDTAMQGHRDFVASMSHDELSVPTMGVYTGVVRDNSGKFAPLD